MAKTQPRKDADFIAFARNLNVNCTTRETEWQLDAAKVSQLGALTGVAWDAYNANKNPETASRQTAAHKRLSFDRLRGFLSTYIPVLVADELISEDDLAAMGLPSREHHYHGPLPIPADAPETTTIVGQHHDITIYVAIPQHGHPSEFLTRKGYYGFVVRYRKEGEEEWHEEHATRLHLTLLFENEDEGKRIALTTAWINPRLQHGPWSDEISVLIN